MNQAGVFRLVAVEVRVMKGVGMLVSVVPRPIGRGLLLKLMFMDMKISFVIFVGLLAVLVFVTVGYRMIMMVMIIVSVVVMVVTMIVVLVPVVVVLVPVIVVLVPVIVVLVPVVVVLVPVIVMVMIVVTMGGRSTHAGILLSFFLSC